MHRNATHPAQTRLLPLSPRTKSKGMKRLLFSPDLPAAGGGAPPADPPVADPPASDPPPPDPASRTAASDPPPPDPASRTAADPPAAKIVVESTKSERETNLEAEIAAEKEARKKEQTRLAELEDENHNLKKARENPASKPAKKSGRFGFFGE